MTDIALLFARDPFKHTDQDITDMVEHYRASRMQFEATGRAPKKLNEKEQVVSSLKLDLDGMDF